MSANFMLRFPALTLAEVRAFYAQGNTPADLVREVYRRIGERGEDAVWIHLPPLDQALERLPTDSALPLFGVPFAVKDNMDVAGWPTTAGCREFSYLAQTDAFVIKKLREAGAIPIGKTNLDQFATGLVGARSPFGIPRSVFDARYISGGSSSGSAVAVAAGLVSFSLGTDTAGSGRVPAAFNGIVGLKPSRGLLSMSGVVPACRSLDCISIFAANCADTETVFSFVRGWDETDVFSRKDAEAQSFGKETLRIGVPPTEQLEFFGNAEASALFQEAVERITQLGFAKTEIDFAPFRDAAKLLYSGPWVAERVVAIEPFFEQHADALHPITRAIIGHAKNFTAADTFRGIYELERLRRLAAREWEKMDALLLPTTGTIYTVEAVLADPIALNSNLGFYTNFVNLLDLCGLAVSAGMRGGLPFGVTFLAPAFSEKLIGEIGRAFLGEHSASVRPPEKTGEVLLAVVGAHLSGQPLNWQLADREARLVRTCRTAADYRLFALANSAPPKPGLVRAPGFSGRGIEVEVWSLATEAFGDFVAQIPPPMTIGTVVLEDGSMCKGFLCEPCVCEGAPEITELGGWRNYLASKT